MFDLAIAKIDGFKNRRPALDMNADTEGFNDAWFHPKGSETVKRIIQFLAAWREGCREGRQMHRDARSRCPFIDV